MKRDLSTSGIYIGVGAAFFLLTVCFSIIVFCNTESPVIRGTAIAFSLLILLLGILLIILLRNKLLAFSDSLNACIDDIVNGKEDVTFDLESETLTGKFNYKLQRLYEIMPAKSNEILLEQSFLTYIGSKAKTGDSISLNLGKGEKEYKITGILVSSSADSQNYTVIVSKAFIEGNENADSYKTSAYVRLKNTDKLSDDDLNQVIYSLADKVGISKSDVSIETSEYRMQGKNNASNFCGLAALFVVILFGADLVIYSIFYISVTGKVHADPKRY